MRGSKGTSEEGRRPLRCASHTTSPSEGEACGVRKGGETPHPPADAGTFPSRGRLLGLSWCLGSILPKLRRVRNFGYRARARRRKLQCTRSCVNAPARFLRCSSFFHGRPASKAAGYAWAILAKGKCPPRQAALCLPFTCKGRRDNPSVIASQCHLPLHKGRLVGSAGTYGVFFQSDDLCVTLDIGREQLAAERPYAKRPERSF